jgi:hypothetical protein
MRILDTKDSLVNILKTAVNKEQVEAYLYSSEANTAASYMKNSFTLKEDAKVIFVDHMA